MTNIDNLIIAAVGLSTMGGIVYGSYELLKDVPQPVTKLLEIKKKVLLEDSDTGAWNQSWQQYIAEHTKTIPAQEETQAPSPPRTPQTREVVDNTDIWELHDWAEKKSQKETAPQSFKDKCREKYNSKQPGIWTKEYKNFEKYCTKDAPTDD